MVRYTLQDIHCIIYIILYTLYYVHCKIYIVLRTLYYIHCVIYIVRYDPRSPKWTMRSARRDSALLYTDDILYYIHSILHYIHNRLCYMDCLCDIRRRTAADASCSRSIFDVVYL
jgi:hypothetical protein